MMKKAKLKAALFLPCVLSALLCTTACSRSQLVYESTSKGNTCYISYTEDISGNLVIPGVSPEGKTVVGIVDYAFRNRTGLTSVTIPASVTDIGNLAFAGCTGLTGITVEEGNPVYHSQGNCLIETASKTLIVGCRNSVIPDDGSVTSIGAYAFYGCSGLTGIAIPDAVTVIGDRAFGGCSSLADITIPDSVTDIGELAFYGCSRLASITIPSHVTSIGTDAFRDCTGLVHMEVAEDNPVYHSQGNCLIETASRTLLWGCEQSFIPDDGSVTAIGDTAFYGCNHLTSITIPASVTSIGRFAFAECYTLVEVHNLSELPIRANPSGYGHVGYYAMNVYGPDSGSSRLIQVGEFTFFNDVGNSRYYLVGYTGAESNVVLPNSIDGHAYEIYRYAFYRCKNLKSITIPTSVTGIGALGFSGCSYLKNITYEGTQSNWVSMSKGSGWNTNTSEITVHCTDGNITEKP